MAWRMLVRRVPTRSMTIVGDVAQTSSSAGAQSWASALSPVLRDSWRIEELTVSYRTPAEVADAAQRVAKAAGLPASPLTAAREVPGAIEYLRVTEGGGGAEVADAVVRLTKEFVSDDGSGRVAVIVAGTPDGPGARVEARSTRDVVAAAIRSGFPGPEAARLLAQRTEDRQVGVLSPLEVKGLEYDAVVLVEPADIAQGPGGFSDLYVAMTRPTQRLVVVHSQDLPDGFAG